MRFLATTILLMISPAVGFAQEVGDVAPMGCALGAEAAACEANAAQLRREIPKAKTGDYQSQRNVSFCLVDGCQGAIRSNRALGCAWRLVILVSGSTKVDDTDVGFLDAYCAKRLDAIGTAIAKAQAASIYREVYRREMPLLAWGEPK